MNWQATYRDECGKKKTRKVQADSREEAFKIFEKRNLSIIKISPENNDQTVLVSQKLWKLIVGIVISIIVLALIILICKAIESREGSKPPTEEKTKPSLDKKDKPQGDKDEKQIEATPHDIPDPSIISIKKTINPFTGEEILFTNRHAQIKANTSVISRDFGNNKHKPKRLLFKHFSENYICGIMRTAPGTPIVRGRLPKNFDQDFLDSYASDIEIDKEDTDEDIAYKKAMKEFKDEVREEISNGASISQIVFEAREEHNKLAEFRKKVLRTIADLKRENIDKQTLDDAREAANIILQEKGLKPIPEDLPRKEKNNE